MPHTGEDLGVDIYNLWVAGTRHLPAVADQFRHARTELFRTTGTDEVFHRSPSIGGTWRGPAFEGFNAFRDAMGRVLQDSADNMDAAGHALETAAQGYAATDAEAGERFSKLRADGADGAY
ncbi:WXG100 family type VII secretion target [Actinoplanes sp. RD1]|uniref:WXG100 family type VII secretion target n=1 Tax=Actinoplanes sp. RD1 TaxID=3064538 RepID=UPI0027417A74|nr:hypothetical protein [Actinoplanes sp. RD1]